MQYRIHFREHSNDPNTGKLIQQDAVTHWTEHPDQVSVEDNLVYFDSCGFPVLGIESEKGGQVSRQEWEAEMKTSDPAKPNLMQRFLGGVSGTIKK